MFHLVGIVYSIACKLVGKEKKQLCLELRVCACVRVCERETERQTVSCLLMSALIFVVCGSTN